MDEIKGIKTFCRLVLPLVYSDELSYYEQMCKVSEKLNEVIEQTNANTTLVNQLNAFVNDYFNNLNVQEEIDNKLNQMAGDGTLLSIINDSVLNRKFLFVGDSYMLGYSQSGALYTPFTKYIKENSGLDIESVATSGAGFANAGTGPNEGKNFLQTLQTYTGVKSKITDIVVCGGYNDRTHNSVDITNAIKTFINYVHDNFVNAKIHVGFIGWSLNPNEYEALRNTIQIYASSGLYGMAYIYGSSSIMHQISYFDNDGIHPNNLGQNMIGTYLASYLCGGQIENFKDLAEINVPDYNSVGFGNIFITQHDNIITMYTQGSKTLNTSGFSDATWADSFTQITGGIADGELKGYFTANTTQVCLAKLTGEDKYTTFPCTLRMTGGIFYLNVLAYKNSEKYTGKIDSIIIPGFSVTIDTALC